MAKTDDDKVRGLRASRADNAKITPVDIGKTTEFTGMLNDLVPGVAQVIGADPCDAVHSLHLTGLLLGAQYAKDRDALIRLMDFFAEWFGPEGSGRELALKRYDRRDAEQTFEPDADQLPWWAAGPKDPQ